MRIAVIHATRLAIDPVAQAFTDVWPQADVLNILDDTLPRDRAEAGKLTNALAGRISALADYAVDAGAMGILYSCSAFGPAIRNVARRLQIPVLTPNEAMFDEALAAGGQIGLLASFEPSVASMAEEFASASGGTPLIARCVRSALEALEAGDPQSHDRQLAEDAKHLKDCQTIMLAQFSTARAADAVAKATQKTVLTSPHSAVRALKTRMGIKATVSGYNVVKT